MFVICRTATHSVGYRRQPRSKHLIRHASEWGGGRSMIAQDKDTLYQVGT